MKISLAEVTNRFDSDRNQKFEAKIHSIGMSEKWINFTSPYVTGARGGFVGHVPGKDTQILVVDPHDTGDWYYLASTFNREPVVGSDVEKGEVMTTNLNVSNRVTDIAGETGAGTGEPLRIVLQDNAGNNLGLYNEQRPDAMNIKAELRSGLGKRVTLTDSLKQDKIVIDTGSKSGASRITLGATDPDNGYNPANSVEVFTSGPQKYINTESQTSMLVEDGREMNFINNSTGTNAQSGSPQNEYYGNINTQSKYRDINTFTLAEKGRIFIQCLNTDGTDQVIQLETNGEGGAIRIITNGKVDISAGDIGISTAGSINVRAGGNFNVDAGGEMNFRAGGNINSDGAQIHLNSGESSTATPSIGVATSYYGNTGVIIP